MTNPLALIIEDDEHLARIFSLTLQGASFDAEIAKDGEIALKRLAEIKPELVVLDLHLPQVAGRSILHQIRADKRLTNTRVMLATADARMAESLRLEADIVLLKPISTSQLQQLAERLCSEYLY